jgi:hemerythrin-like metal-binding protein
MTNIKWLDSFGVGVRSIDDDHRELIRIIQEIETSIEEERGNLCESLIPEFFEKARQHFVDEEHILRKINFPKLEEHQSQHQELLKKGEKIREICVHSGNGPDIEKRLEEMIEFLLGDILEADMQFKSYLQESDLADY